VAAYNQSRVKMFRRCQKQYSFRYDTAGLLGMDPDLEMVPVLKKKGLTKGSWMHSLMEAYHRQWAYDSGFSAEQIWPDGEPITWGDVQDELTHDFEQLFEEEREEYGDLPGETRRMWLGYLRKYKDDFERYRVAELEDGSPAIEFIVEQPLTRWGLSYPFKGQIDILLEDLEYGGLWIRDAKWVKSVPAADERMMSPQALLYVWALRRDGLDIRGFIYDYGRTKAPTLPRVLKAGTLSLAKKMDTTYETYLQAVKDLHGDKWKLYVKHVYLEKLRELKAREVLWFDRQRIPVEPDRVKRGLAEFIQSCRDIERRHTKNIPRSYFYNCRFGCEYHDPCVAQFQGLDIAPLIKANYQFEGERYGDQTEKDLLSA
jgi:hypothetical protein